MITVATASDIEQKAVHELRTALAVEPQWIKVHAAEALLNRGYAQGVRETFLREAEVSSDMPKYRIGVWRVLAQADGEEAQRHDWAGKICDVFCNENSPDRTHAAEALAKLGYVAPEELRIQLNSAVESQDNGLALYAAWALIQSGNDAMQNKVAEGLQSNDPIDRLRSAFILQRLRKISPSNRAALHRAARDESAESTAYGALVSASFVVGGRYDDPLPAMQHDDVLKLLTGDNAAAKRFALEAIGERGTTRDLPGVTNALRDNDADVRVFAADAVLQIVGRHGT
jgi:SSS family solute:Na+ symporter